MSGVRIDERTGRRLLGRRRLGLRLCQERGGGFEDQLGLFFLPCSKIGSGQVLETKSGHFGAAVGCFQLGDVDVEVETRGGDRKGLGDQGKRRTHGAGLGVGLRALGEKLNCVVDAALTRGAVGQTQVRAELHRIDVENSAVHALRFCKPSCAQMGACPGQGFLRASNHHR